MRKSFDLVTLALLGLRKCLVWAIAVLSGIIELLDIENRLIKANIIEINLCEADNKHFLGIYL